MFRRSVAVAILASAAVTHAAEVCYDGTVFPEEAGFARAGTFDADRSVADGVFSHHVELGQWDPPPYGEQDFYRFDLDEFVGRPFFAEWRMTSDAPRSEVDENNGAGLIVFTGGGVGYHFNMASDFARILRGYPFPTIYFDIEAGVPHTYRLEVYGADYFEFQIDGLVVDSGLPEAEFPSSDALMSFGTRFYMDESTSNWDYVRFGTIPEPATGLLVLLGAVPFAMRRSRRR